MPTANKFRASSNLVLQSPDQHNMEGALKERPTQAQSREYQIRLAAYLAAEKRGFAPGLETEDWITAEQQVDEAERTETGSHDS